MLSGCQSGFLDQVPDDRLTEDDIFATLNNTEMYLANVYSMIPDESMQRFVTNNGSGPWTGGSSEGEYAPWSTVPNAINVGNWNAGTDWVGTFWERYYQGIRNATYFMQNANFDLCTDCGQARIERYKLEARALRAYYYYQLMRIFGPVVLMGDDILPADVKISEMQMPRSSFDECVAYVVGEFDAVAKELPSTPIGGQYGRMTRSIALAYKQELLTLAASPLFNGNTDYANMVNDDGKQLISQAYDAGKWQKAAAASKAYLDEFVPTYHELFRKNNSAGEYSAFLSCRDVLLQSWNKEWIMGRSDAGVTWIQYEVTPYHAGAAQESRGGGGLGATQEAVDAYFMANGLSPILGYNADGSPIVNSASGFQTTGFSQFQAPDDTQVRETYNQWVNREPRFYVGITYNGRLWLNPNTAGLVTYTYYTGNSGASQSQWDYSPTGYNSRKNINPGSKDTGGRAFCLYRLAMVYLNYAEALNESNPGHPDILATLNLIRERAGIPGYGQTGDLPVPASKEAMRQAIHKERLVEFAFENARWFDVRRWKIAEQTENGPMYGLDIHSDPPEFYTRVSFENRVFEKKHYLFPLPQTEVLINRKLVQNSGWSER
jgi:hypothetical protein